MVHPGFKLMVSWDPSNSFLPGNELRRYAKVRVGSETKLDFATYETLFVVIWRKSKHCHVLHSYVLKCNC